MIIHDIDEAISTVSRLFIRHRLTLNEKTLALRLRTTMLDEVGVNVLDYGTEVIVESEPLKDFHLIVFPMTGRANMTIGRRAWEVNSLQAALPPLEDREWAIRLARQMCQLAIYLPRKTVETIAAALGGSDADVSIRLILPPVLDLGSSRGKVFSSALRHLHEEAASGYLATLPTFARRRLIESFISRFLYAATPDLFLKEVAVGHQKRNFRAQIVDEFLDLARSTHGQERTLAEIACALRLPLRTLEIYVQEQLATTPSNILLSMRLDRVRQLLLVASPRETTVSAVAMECGFFHLGRFAAQYRARFGEPPSTTLRG